MSSVRYEQIDSNRPMTSVSKEIFDYWKESGVIRKVLNDKTKPKQFVFLEGPPTANGRPHVGHAMTRTIKDIVLRYKYMTGHTILRRTGGWDCHGLPVELEAEKHFGFKTKKDIEDYGIEKFNEYCRESVFKYIDEWMDVDNLLGFWIDHDNAYVTLRNDYIESEWWALKELFERNLLVKDYKIVPYCPRCETSLSSHEVSQGYDEVKDPSVYVKFRVKGFNNRYFIAWTTTPWTLPSNEFLAVNDKIEYVLVRQNDEEFYLANEVLNRLFKDRFEIMEKCRGEKLVGLEYEQLLPFLGKPNGTMKVVSGDHVTVDEGSGIVHTSPAFGADDFEIGRNEGVEILNPVNLSGKFDDERLPWKGLFVKDADIEIIKYLKENKLLFKSEKITHTYPFCYRCDSPLLYYPLNAWFIKVSSIRPDLMKNNSKINWLPDFIKEGRFGNFLSEAKDWSLSRNRYWGTPLPVWVCKNEHYKAIGSRDEISALNGEPPKDLHRPYVDSVTFKCPECGETMRREPYVIDTWFDSGSATYAALHYPFIKVFSPDKNFPIDFIIEAVDQTRGWFYTLHVISSLLFGKNAYKNAMSIDFILDEQGRKMSKSRGNSVFALDFVREFGPDPIRLFFLNGAPWKPKSIDKRLISELTRRILVTPMNIYSFFSSNANIDEYEFSGLKRSNNLLDRWIVSRVNSTASTVTQMMNSYDIHNALKEIQDLIEDLSNFYLRLSRRRFWAETMDAEKEAAYSTLYYSLLTLLKLMAPITPFTSEYLYKKLTNDGKSVHEEDFPIPDESKIDKELEGYFSVASSIIEGVRRVRQEINVKGRQPVTEILISSSEKIPDEIIEIISPEVNAREIRFIPLEEQPMKYQIKLILSKAAPVLKAKVSEATKLLEESNVEKILEELSIRGKMSLVGTELPKEYFEITEIPDESYGYTKDPRTGIGIFVNRKIDEDLAMEGLARELIRRIQVMRKDKDLEYYQKITTYITAEERINKTIEKFKQWIMEETLSDDIFLESVEGSKEWEIDGSEVNIAIQPH